MLLRSVVIYLLSPHSTLVAGHFTTKEAHTKENNCRRDPSTHSVRKTELRRTAEGSWQLSTIMRSYSEVGNQNKSQGTTNSRLRKE
jgi:hypothetical protein